MTLRKRFAVVIPLYNKAATITRALQSVFEQTRCADIIVVVDDGSTDDSVQRCEAVLADAPVGIECRLIRQANAGVSVARNVGFDTGNGDYAAFLDADDEWLPTHLAELERLAQACPDAGILSTRHARCRPGHPPRPAPTVLPAGFFGIVENGLTVYRRGYGILHTSTIAVERSAWQRSGGFPPGARKSQDIHLWLRLLLTNSFAHSSNLTGIWHEEETGVVRRMGALPSHFSYFLGSEEGRRYLVNHELQNFLATNMVSHIAGHRLRQDNGVVTDLVALSRHLPVTARFKIRAVAVAPWLLLRAIQIIRDRGGLR